MHIFLCSENVFFCTRVDILYYFVRRAGHKKSRSVIKANDSARIVSNSQLDGQETGAWGALAL